jgi:hypothetical protein
LRAIAATNKVCGKVAPPERGEREPFILKIYFYFEKKNKILSLLHLARSSPSSRLFVSFQINVNENELKKLIFLKKKN